MDDQIGKLGVAVNIPVDPFDPYAAETLVDWLVTLNHPQTPWNQYIVAVVRLRDNIPGFSAPYRKFEGANHELLMVALNPDYGPYDPEKMLYLKDHGGINYLTPINLHMQFMATEDEMTQLCTLAIKAVLDDYLPIEPFTSPSLHDKLWETSLNRTLEHIRWGGHEADLERGDG